MKLPSLISNEHALRLKQYELVTDDPYCMTICFETPVYQNNTYYEEDYLAFGNEMSLDNIVWLNGTTYDATPFRLISLTRVTSKEGKSFHGVLRMSHPFFEGE